jgi:hypothetical protein
MKRKVLVVLAVVSTVMAAGAVMVAQQQPKDEVRPGYASQAKILVINHGTKEAIPVAIDASSELLRVQVAGTAAVQIAGTPNVQARHARQMWEYRQLVLPAGQDPTASLNAAGLDGWEATGIALATADATRVILKRPTDR